MDMTTGQDMSWWHDQGWQIAEDRVDEHIRCGEVQYYGSVEELLADLHCRAAQ